VSVAALLSRLEDPAVIVDATGAVMDWNDAAAAAGLVPGEGTGRATADAVGPGRTSGAVRLDLADGSMLLVWPATATVGDDDIARQRVRILEHLAPGVAHDLINQVGGIQSFLQVADGFDRGDRRLLDETAARAIETVKAFQDLVRSRRTGAVDVSPSRLVGDALALAAHPLQEVAVTVDVPDDLAPVHGEPGDLRQALLAVIVNTLDALGWPVAHGELRVSARPVGDGVALIVEDDAPTIPTATLPRLFDPRPPAASGRAPLDLAVGRHLLRVAGGDLRAEPAGVPGNRFVLALPVPEAVSEPDDVEGLTESRAAEGAKRTNGPTAAAGTVIVWDDDESIRALIVRVLGRTDVEAVPAGSRDAALRLIETRPVNLVVAGHHPGSMAAIDLYRRAVDLRPELLGRFVLLSDEARDPDLLALAGSQGLAVIEKPFDVDHLALVIREVLSR
jgi:signal transduction histidine kinase/CheY-like chemotaxis protein